MRFFVGIRDHRLTLTLASGAALVALVSTRFSPTPATAYPSYVTEWFNAHPSSQSMDNMSIGTGSACQMCHANPNGGNGWNAYGWELRTLTQTGTQIDTALLLVQGVDSDQDVTGSTNLAEIDLHTQPGWKPGATNTFYLSGGTTTPNQNPPSGVLGSLDPFTTAYCFGDGSGTACPCGNASAPGAGQGCANSTGQGAVLRAAPTASGSFGANNLVLLGSNLLPSQPALLFVGNNAVNGGNGILFGDGLRCAGVGVRRLGVKTPNAQGNATWGPGLNTAGGWAPGDTKRMQIWYRNPTGSPCGSNFNLSNGLEIRISS